MLSIIIHFCVSEMCFQKKKVISVRYPNKIDDGRLMLFQYQVPREIDGLY